MIKKILFYVAAFAVSLVFASNAYAADDADKVIYDIDPSMSLLSTSPIVYGEGDFSTGLIDTYPFTFEYFSDPDYPSTVTSFPLKVFDNDLTTALSGSGSTHFSLVFDTATNINSFYIKASDNTYVDFYNSEGIRVSRYYSLSNTTGKYISHTANGIVRITIGPKTISQSTFISELDFFGERVFEPVKNIVVDAGDISADFEWTLPKGDIDHLNFDGKDIGKSVKYIYKNLKPDTEYTVAIDVVYKDGTVVTAKYTFKTDKPKDVLPPGEVTDFKSNPDKTFVDLSWSLPNDEDYEKLLLYRDNVLIKTLTTETNYKDEKLNEDTTYKYKIITVDKSGNKSEGKIITVLTKFTQTNLPPDEPLGLTAKPLSKGVKLSWKNPTSGSVKGYKIYMFEKDVASNNILDKFVITAKAASTPTQVNTGLLSSTSYQVSGLENGTTYGFYIVAVNSSGLSSVPSNTVYATPTINSVPPVNIGGGGSGSNGSNNAGFALSDVTNGVSSWFGSIWLILAFAIGIMVSFIIANRIKKLFVS